MGGKLGGTFLIIRTVDADAPSYVNSWEAVANREMNEKKTK